MRDLFPNKETRSRIAWLITVITFVLTLLKDWKKILAGINEILFQPNWRLVFFSGFAWLGYVLLTIEAVAILFVFSGLIIFFPLWILCSILHLEDESISDWILIVPAFVSGVVGAFVIFPFFLRQPDAIYTPSWIMGYLFAFFALPFLLGDGLA